MSQPTAANTAPAPAAAPPQQLPPTHEVQLMLEQNVESLRQLADARRNGDALASEALVKRVHVELAALAAAADLQNNKPEAAAMAGRPAAQ